MARMTRLEEIRKANAASARLGRNKTWHPDVVVALHKAHQEGHVGEAELRPLFTGMNTLSPRERTAIMASALRLVSRRAPPAELVEHLATKVPRPRPPLPTRGIATADDALEVISRSGVQPLSIGVFAAYPKLAMVVGNALSEGQINTETADLTSDIILHAEQERRTKHNADKHRQLARRFDQIHGEGAFNKFYEIVTQHIAEKLGTARSVTPPPRAAYPVEGTREEEERRLLSGVLPGRATTPRPTASEFTLPAVRPGVVPADIIEPRWDIDPRWAMTPIPTSRRVATPLPFPAPVVDEPRERGTYVDLTPKEPQRISLEEFRAAHAAAESAVDSLPRKTVIKYGDLHPDVKEAVDRVADLRTDRIGFSAIPAVSTVGLGSYAYGFQISGAENIYKILPHLNSTNKAMIGALVTGGVVGVLGYLATSRKVRKHTQAAINTAFAVGQFDAAGEHKVEKYHGTHPLAFIKGNGDIVLLPKSGWRRFVKVLQHIPLIKHFAGRYRAKV